MLASLAKWDSEQHDGACCLSLLAVVLAVLQYKIRVQSKTEGAATTSYFYPDVPNNELAPQGKIRDIHDWLLSSDDELFHETLTRLEFITERRTYTPTGELQPTWAVART